jgi:hypothetical protein
MQKAKRAKKNNKNCGTIRTATTWFGAIDEMAEACQMQIEPGWGSANANANE